MPEKKPSAAALRAASKCRFETGISWDEGPETFAVLIDREFAPLVEAARLVCACLKHRIVEPPDRQEVENLQRVLIKIEKED